MRREPGALSTLDGGDAADFLLSVTADVSSAESVLVERLLFSRAATNALVKTGETNLELENCLFASNGLTAFRCEGAATVRGCRFMANRSASADGLVLVRGSVAVSFANCLFAGNELGKAGGLVTLREAARYQAPTVDFDRCTFACNLGAQATSVCGILAENGRANVRNSIFGSSVFSAAHSGAEHVLVKSGAAAAVDYTLFPAGGEDVSAIAEAGGTLLSGEAVRFRDADFRTPPEAFAALVTQTEEGLPVLDPERLNEVFGLDFHVRNSDGFYSAAIDTGDPETPVGDEPAPNGGRVNLGFYGGTREAALSKQGGVLIVR